MTHSYMRHDSFIHETWLIDTWSIKSRLQKRNMGWLRSVGSIKLQVFFAEYFLFYRVLLQKRLIILSILLSKATAYTRHTLRHSHGVVTGTYKGGQHTYSRYQVSFPKETYTRRTLWQNHGHSYGKPTDAVIVTGDSLWDMTHSYMRHDSFV